MDVECTFEENVPGSDGEVRCFCNDRREIGVMVQCEVCVGWFHLECLRKKEGVVCWMVRPLFVPSVCL